MKSPLPTVRDNANKAAANSVIRAFSEINPLSSKINAIVSHLSEASDELRIRKVAEFVGALIDAKTEGNSEVPELTLRMNDNELWQRILLVIERCDEIEKAPVLARLMRAMIDGHLCHDVAFRLCHAVNRSYFADLATLRSFEPGLQKEESIAEVLRGFGFLKFVGQDGGDFVDPHSGGVHYDLSYYGKLLIKVGLR